MFTEIKLENGHENAIVRDVHMISFHPRGSGRDVEVVIHPSREGAVSVRTAREPYACVLHLEDGCEIHCDLGCEEDWGEIDTTFCAWGNDADGYRRIVRVTSGLDDIPLSDFLRDVRDFVVYYEG